ncbi:MAG: XdhC family protein [Acidimicrobiia bacterium]
MYSIALSVSTCIRAGTRVDVAWIVDRQQAEPSDPNEAVAITPGGGRLGSLMSGALDGQLIELAAVQGRQGRLCKLDIGPSDAAISGVEPAVGIACLLVPATELPDDLWQKLLDREPVCLVSQLDGDSVISTALYTSDTISEAVDSERRVFGHGASITEIFDDTVVTVLWPTSTLVIVGAGEIADSLRRLASAIGWQSATAGNPREASGLIAGLSPLDSVVVLGHDLELSGGGLMAALESDVGYIGGVGPKHLQESRSDWLAYRGFTDLSRIRGRAGLDIGARNPQEIALAIAAEIVATQTASA